MDFIEQIKALATRSQNHIDQIVTEEGTKHALVLPFLTALGYDTFNPIELVPEHPADIGIKKGEKVDYAICQDGAPVIIIECKSAKSTLDSADISQLFRYFTATDAKFGILTNGTSYWFYTDLLAPNKMDVEPFLKFELFDFTPRDVKNLRLFSKDSFDLSETLQAVSDIRYRADIKGFLSNQINRPDDDFVRYVRDRVCPKSETRPDQDQFTRLLQECLQEIGGGSIAGPTPVHEPGPGPGKTKTPAKVPETIMDHVVVVLSEAKQPLKMTPLGRRAIQNGVKSTLDVIRRAIYKEIKRPSPRIVKDGKNYGLPKWYQKPGIVIPISRG